MINNHLLDKYGVHLIFNIRILFFLKNLEMKYLFGVLGNLNLHRMTGRPKIKQHHSRILSPFGVPNQQGLIFQSGEDPHLKIRVPALITLHLRELIPSKAGLVSNKKNPLSKNRMVFQSTTMLTSSMTVLRKIKRIRIKATTETTTEDRVMVAAGVDDF